MEGKTCIHDVIADQAERIPDAVALKCDASAVTYRELNSRANAFANALYRHGVGPEIPVGLCIERSIDSVVGLLGILKAGGVYVPLNPTLPPQRLADMVRDSNIRVIVTRREYRDRLPQNSITILDLDALKASTEHALTVLSGVTPENAAYVIYTSGSTGKPKGIIGIHRGILRSLTSWEAALPMDAVRCVRKSLSVAGSIGALLCPLALGSRVVIVPEKDTGDVCRFIDIVESERVTGLSLVPIVLGQVLEIGPDITKRLSKVRSVKSGGSHLSPDLIKAFFNLLPDAELVYHYGSSETGFIMRIENECAVRGQATGRPGFGTQVYVLDDKMNPVPIGLPGEIHIAGKHLFRGYVNKPALTAERFVANPFGEPGERLYKTGDLGRLELDGRVTLLTRTDRQVKVRGFRIELDEIETVLEKHKGVQECFLTTHGGAAETRLIAYVSAKPEMCLSITNLRTYLTQCLPSYLMPSLIIVVPQLPRTPNGKIDCSALPLPDTKRPELDNFYIEAKTCDEKVLADIWAEVLGFERIGIYDDFLDLGGDSLAAMRIVSRIVAQLGVQMSVGSIFEHRTIAELLGHVSLQGVPQSVVSEQD
jgi:amino acid adenylation domain-containing protein